MVMDWVPIKITSRAAVAAASLFSPSIRVKGERF